MLGCILVATDFSISADAAWRFAVNLAATTPAETRLLHVTMPCPSAADPAHRDAHQRHTASALRLLEQRIALATSRAVPTKMLLQSGEVADVIVTAARDEGAAVIVVGSHGRPEPTGLLIGSVAERVVRVAGCTVIVVKQPPEPMRKAIATRSG